MSPGTPVNVSPATPDSNAERLAYSVDEAARLTGLSRDLLYDQMRRGKLPYVKIGRRRSSPVSTWSSSWASRPDQGSGPFRLP